MSVCVSGEQHLGTEEIKQCDMYRVSGGVGNQILSSLSEGRISPGTQVFWLGSGFFHNVSVSWVEFWTK